MPKEYELRFTNFNKNQIITKLKELGATQLHKAIIFEYIVFKHPLNKANTYIRVRKEFDKITFTYKTNTDKKFVDEYEVNISDYDQFIKIFLMLGFKKAYAINKLREKWIHKNLFKEVVFDTYPGLPELMEIECNTKLDLDKMVKILNLKEEKYFRYYETLYDVKPQKKKKLEDLTFDTAKKVFKNKIRKNRTLFNKILKIQQTYIKTLK
jgi:predicted adenylyl cyclase CyaB